MSATTTTAPTRETTLESIRETLSGLAAVPLPGDDESLFDSGVLDSFALMDAIARLEERLDVKVPDADLNPRRFETVSKIERYFASRLSARPSA